MKKQIFAGLIAGAALFTLAACSSNSSSGSSSSSSDSSLSGKIVAGGSTALQPLAQQASTEFTAKNPKVTISVQPGGSGVGLQQVSSGAFQIGNSDIFAEEKTGIDASKITDNKVAVVGFEAIANSSVKGVDNLTTQQLTDIFTGKVTNWKEVGGPDLKITVIERTAGSGTRTNFDKLALGGAAEMTGAATQDATGAVVTAVGQTPGSISYVAFSGMANNPSGVKGLKLNGVDPTDANVESNKYKVWSYEHMYTLSSADNKAEDAFIKYVAADTTDLKKLGYIAVGDMKVDRDAKGNITNK